MIAALTFISLDGGLFIIFVFGLRLFIDKINLLNKIMDRFDIQENAFTDKTVLKLSPLTSAGTLSQAEEKVFIEDNFLMQLRQRNSPSICKNNLFKTFSIEEKTSKSGKQFLHIQKQIMEYFELKGVKAGHPQQLKKDYNRRLHKRVSMLVEVTQVVIQKAQEGSSLLQRRLKKKMTINL